MSDTKKIGHVLVKNNNKADTDLWIGSDLVWVADDLDIINQSSAREQRAGLINTKNTIFWYNFDQDLISINWHLMNLYVQAKIISVHYERQKMVSGMVLESEI